MSNTGKDAADTEMIQSQNFQETDYGRYSNVQYHKTKAYYTGQQSFCVNLLR